MLSPKQRIQEEEYQLPYHWFKNRNTVSGRIYFGYQNICLNLIKDIKKDAKILDAGCGDGRFLGALKENGFDNLFGVDYSEKAVSFARLLLPSVSIEVADLTSLPYEDNSFDVVFIIETLEHIIPENLPRIIANLQRIIKPSGKLVVTVPSVNAPLLENSKHYQHFSVESMTAYLQDYFEVKEFIGQDKIGFSLFKIFYSFLENRFWDLKKIRQCYNEKIWPAAFNKCQPRKGRRLIFMCEKK